MRATAPYCSTTITMCNRKIRSNSGPLLHSRPRSGTVASTDGAAQTTKDSLFLRIAALRAVREVVGQFPCRIKVMVEGEEEIGSPHVEFFVQEHKDLLAADGCVWEFGGVNDGGIPRFIWVCAACCISRCGGGPSVWTRTPAALTICPTLRGDSFERSPQ